MRKWRELFHIPQVVLAESLGVSPSVISDYESGRRQSPGSRTIKRFVEAIIALDSQNGNQVVNAFRRLMGVEIPTTIVIDISEFDHPIQANMFLESIRGEIAACKDLLLNRELMGYIVVDNTRALHVLSNDGYIKLYEATMDRALIITNVSTGRSPLIAIQDKLKPSLFVLHGIEEPDYLAIELAQKERVPLAISKIDTVETLLRRLHHLQRHTDKPKGATT